MKIVKLYHLIIHLGVKEIHLIFERKQHIPIESHKTDIYSPTFALDSW